MLRSGVGDSPPSSPCTHLLNQISLRHPATYTLSSGLHTRIRTLRGIQILPNHSAISEMEWGRETNPRWVANYTRNPDPRVRGESTNWMESCAYSSGINSKHCNIVSASAPVECVGFSHRHGDERVWSLQWVSSDLAWLGPVMSPLHKGSTQRPDNFCNSTYPLKRSRPTHVLILTLLRFPTIALHFPFQHHASDIVYYIVITILSGCSPSLVRSCQWTPRRRIGKCHLGNTSVSWRECGILGGFTHQWGSKIRKQKSRPLT